MSALLDIRDLCIQRGKRTVVEIKNLTVEKGEVMAVIGPNGAGKSSLLLAMARLLQPEKGEMFWEGVPVGKINPLAYRRRIGLVLQEPLLLDMPVFDNVALGLRFRGAPQAGVNEKVIRWLKRLGIDALSKRPGSQLSGGEAQRVSLARAFVLNPELILLDEPFSALDSPTRLRLLEDLQAILAETGTTAIIITHDLQEASRLATRVAVMLEGQIVQIGPPLKVFGKPATQAAAEFLGTTI